MNTTKPARSADLATPVPGVAIRMVFDRDRNPFEFGRVLALSDGVFAIALTLLVLDLALPEAAARTTLGQDLVGRRTNFFAFAISVLLVGNVWLTHHRLFSLFQSIDGTVMGANVLYLGMAALFPFIQSAVAGYALNPLAYILFAALVVGLLLVDAAIFLYGWRKGLFRVEPPRRWVRYEFAQSAVNISVFLATIPLALLIGPFVVTIWVASMPVQAVLMHRQARESGSPAPAAH
jgi:uncharacterized membrane protein